MRKKSQNLKSCQAVCYISNKMSNTKLLVTVSYVVEVDINDVRPYCEWSESAAKERFLAKYKNTDKDGNRIVNITNLVCQPAPVEVYHDVVGIIKAEIQDCDYEPKREDEQCPKCEVELTADNFDDEDERAEDEEGLCDNCIHAE